MQRNVDSVNYQYHAGPTKVDFRGTVLLPHSKGDATVDSQKGRTDIDAKFEGLLAPQRFGPEYLSYVLWAVTPDGAPHNLGEVVPNGSNRAHLPVTTDLQAFGLIVTAEPYAAVRHPSDVVVLENEIRPDTIGEVKPVQAKVELMPRGKYTWNVPETETAGLATEPRVSMGRYDAILQVYEAQNAIGIAQSEGAQQFAPDVFAKAQAQLNQAQQLEATKGNDDRIVQYARAATETAEDARTIAEKRQAEQAMISVRQDTAQAQQSQLEAQAVAERERQRADQAQAQAQAEHQAREAAEAEASALRATQAAVAAQPAPAPQVIVEVAHSNPTAGEKNLRAQVLQRMNLAIVTRDTPRGLDATLNDADFSGSQLRPEAAGNVAQLAAAVLMHPGLKIAVEGDSDSAEGSGLAGQRAAMVAAALERAGVPARQISRSSAGDSHLIVSNSTERGRIENRRVEIIVSGDAIGTVPTWDRTYSLPFGNR